MKQDGSKIYEKAEIEIVFFEKNDIITTSGSEGGSEWPSDGELDQGGWDS